MLLARRCGAAFSAVVLLAASLVVLPAERADAQFTPFVDNLDRVPYNRSVLAGFDSAFALRTGGAEYILRSVDLAYDTFSRDYDPSHVTVRIHADSGGSPGGSLGTLAHPDSLPASYQDQVLTFTSAGIELAADTTYWLVFDVQTAYGSIPGQTPSRIELARADAEDYPYSSGWSLGHGYAWRDRDSTGAWTLGTPHTPQVAYRGEVRVPPRSRSEIYRQRVDYERSSEAQLQRFEAVYDEVCRGTWGGAGVTCVVVDHFLTDGTADGTATLVITCNPGYDCDLDIDYRELNTDDPQDAVSFTPTYTTPPPYQRATITPRRATNPIRTVSINRRTITYKGFGQERGVEQEVTFVNGRIDEGYTRVYEPITITRFRPDGTPYDPARPDGQFQICEYLPPITVSDGNGNTVTIREGQYIFPDADGKCRSKPSVNSTGIVSGGEYTTHGYQGRVRQVTAPTPPVPVPIPDCFDTEQREVHRSITTRSGPTDTVTAITGYSRCTDAEYYRYLDAEEQQLADHYAAEERYIEQIHEQEQRDEPFLQCISQEEWQQIGGFGSRCQILNFDPDDQ